MDLFTIDPGLILWTWITFGVLLLLLGKYVFPPLIKSIQSREEKIRLSVDKAEQIEPRLDDIEREHQAIVKNAQKEADEHIRKSREEAESLRRQILDKAEREVEDIHARARLRIAEERSAAMESMQQEIADLVLEISEKLIGKSFTNGKEREWTKEMVKTL